MVKRQFGLSTHLYHSQRLSREHLLEIAALRLRNGRALRDADALRLSQPGGGRRPAAVARGSGPELHAVHAPVGESFIGGRWGKPLTLASADPEARARAPWLKPNARCRSRGGSRSAVLVAHLGCRAPVAGAGDNSRDGGSPQHRGATAAGGATRRPDRSRSHPERAVAGRIARALRRRGCSTTAGVGICLDFGHAHMEGDLLDAIETASRAPHHDTRARQSRPLRRASRAIRGNDRLAGGTDGGAESRLRPDAAVRDRRTRISEGHAARARKARERLERMLVEWNHLAYGLTVPLSWKRSTIGQVKRSELIGRPMHVYIEEIGKHEGKRSRSRGGCTTAARAGRSIF